jgi:hypothetical protein
MRPFYGWEGVAEFIGLTMVFSLNIQGRPGVFQAKISFPRSGSIPRPLSARFCGRRGVTSSSFLFWPCAFPLAIASVLFSLHDRLCLFFHLRPLSFPVLLYSRPGQHPSIQRASPGPVPHTMVAYAVPIGNENRRRKHVFRATDSPGHGVKRRRRRGGGASGRTGRWMGLDSR